MGGEGSRIMHMGGNPNPTHATLEICCSLPRTWFPCLGNENNNTLTSREKHSDHTQLLDMAPLLLVSA